MTALTSRHTTAASFGPRAALAREGVIGRAAIDFVAVRDGDGWQPYALEINLRSGGTTHPLFALTTLTDGIYDPLAGEWRTRLGDIKHYAATDHLDDPAYQSLTPDDLLDVVAERELGWDSERETGVVLHMVSALAVAGRIGLTAIVFALTTLTDGPSRRPGGAGLCSGRSATSYFGVFCNSPHCAFARASSRSWRSWCSATNWPYHGAKPVGLS